MSDRGSQGYGRRRPVLTAPNVRCAPVLETTTIWLARANFETVSENTLDPGYQRLVASGIEPVHLPLVYPDHYAVV
jgi:hypothetical protein